MTRLGVLAVMAAVMMTACGPDRVVTQGTVERLDVTIEAGVDGAIDVQEAATVTPGGDGAIAWQRVIESPRTDDLRFVSFVVDAEPVDPDGRALTVESDGPRRVVVTWRAERSAPARVELRYRAEAVVGVAEPRGRVEWPVLDAGRTFDVGPTSLEFLLPEGVRMYDGTGMAEPGWTVELTPRGVTARRPQIARAESATVLAVFDVDRARVVAPQWEWDADRGRQFFLALVSAGLFILVVGVGVLIQLRVQYPAAPAGAPVKVVESARRDHGMLARGLRGTAVAGFVFAAVSAALAHIWLRGLGPAAQAIPASIAIVSLLFLAAGTRYAGKVRRGA